MPDPTTRPTLNIEPAGMTGSLNVRMPAAFVHWLEVRAAENQTTVSGEIRNAVATAILGSGEAAAYGITIVEEET